MMKKRVSPFLLFDPKCIARFLILGALVLSFPLHSDYRKSLHQKSLCPSLLRGALNGAKLSVRERTQVLRQNVREQNRMSAELQLAWTEVSTRIKRDGNLQDNENFFWLREDGLRGVNTATHGIAFTERYLLLKDWHLTQILRENNWGTLVHRNFKDRVIVSTMDAKELQRLLLPELARRLKPDFSSPNQEQHLNYLLENTHVGVAKTFEGAHLQSNGFDISKWHKTCTELRQTIATKLESLNIDPSILLEKAFKKKKLSGKEFNESTLTGLLSRNQVDERKIPQLAKEIVEYLNLLQGADLLPPPNALSPEQVLTVENWLKSGRDANSTILGIINRRPWTQRHAMFFKDAFIGKAQHIIALDRKGFSEVAFRYRDDWIRGSNQRQDLRGIYVESTRMLESYFQNLAAQIQNEFGIKVLATFRSGDDALFALPPGLQDEQLRQLDQFLKNHTELYTYIATRKSDKESLGLLIESARTGLSEEKDKQK
jgi:hypothetical protein